MSVVTLASLNASHLQKTFEWLQNPILREQIDSASAPVWENHVKIWGDRFQDPTRSDFAILKDGHHIGNCGLSSIDQEQKKAELWIYIGDPSGRGCGSVALRQLFEYGFEKRNLEKIYLRVLAENTAAVNFYRKNGMTEEGVLKSDSNLPQKMKPSLAFSLLKSEFKK